MPSINRRVARWNRAASRPHMVSAVLSIVCDAEGPLSISSRIYRPGRLAPNDAPSRALRSEKVHPIARVLPLGHTVEGRPCVSGLDGMRRLRVGLPTHGFSTRGGPNVFQQISEPSINRLATRGGLCNNSRGNNKNSFHTLVAARTSLASQVLCEHHVPALTLQDRRGTRQTLWW